MNFLLKIFPPENYRLLEPLALKTGSFLLVAELSTSVCFTSPAFALQSFIIDLNTKEVTDLGSLGGGDTEALAINFSG